MSGRVSVRGGSHLRRGPSVRRASTRVSATRVGAVVVLFAASLGLWQLTSPAAFVVHDVEVDGARLTDRGDVTAALLEGGAGSVFRYDTAAAARRITRFPTVLRADVRAVLPDRLVATVEEREAVLRWLVGDAAFLVDASGLLFVREDTIQAGSVAGGPVGEVRDGRASSATLTVGSQLSTIDLRVARQLVTLTPAMVGSGAAALAVAVDDDRGYVVTAASSGPSAVPSAGTVGWTAVFGVYGEVTRNPELVPLQVQCLASLLADRGEAAVGHVILSPEGQLCGTYGAP